MRVSNRKNAWLDRRNAEQAGAWKPEDDHLIVLASHAQNFTATGKHCEECLPVLAKSMIRCIVKELRPIRLFGGRPPIEGLHCCLIALHCESSKTNTANKQKTRMSLRDHPGL